MRLSGTKLIAAGACALALLASPASAAVIEVSTTADEYGAGPACSLREAITAAERDAAFGGCAPGSGADTVRLAGGQRYVRALAGPNDDANAAGDYDIRGDITLSVFGVKRATIDAGGFDRVLQVLPGAKLTASRLILTNGVLAAPLAGDTSGGGIADAGILQLSRSELSNNHATASLGCGCGGGIAVNDASAKLSGVTIDANAARGAGGGIAFNGGKLSVDKSTIDANASGAGGGGAFLGGSSGLNTAIFTDSTISRNTDTGDGASAGGGGILADNVTGSTFYATNTTLAGNTANGYGGGVFVRSGLVQLSSATVTDNIANSNADPSGQGGGIAGSVDANSSIVAGNFDASAVAPLPDCGAGAKVFHGLLSRDGGCPGPRNRAVANPKLRRLRFNGGPTETVAIGRTSKAVGHAGTPVPPFDQRGRKRDRRPDIGAFEYFRPK